MIKNFRKFLNFIFGFNDDDVSQVVILDSPKINSNSNKYPIYFLGISNQSDFKISSNYYRIKGFTEDLLSKELIKLFPENIYINLKLNFNGISYEPDIAYLDKESNKYFDIEIDEPYTLSANGIIPIHSIDVDNNRNETFRNNGWGVIRVSEKQVFCDLKNTVKYIENVIREIEPNSELCDDNQLSFEQTESAIMNKYRENYLGIISLTSIAKESSIIYGNFTIKNALLRTDTGKIFIHVEDYTSNVYEVYLDVDLVIIALNEAIKGLVPTPYFTNSDMFEILNGVKNFVLVCKCTINFQQERKFINVVNNEIQFIPTPKFIKFYNEKIEAVKKYFGTKS